MTKLFAIILAGMLSTATLEAQSNIQGHTTPLIVPVTTERSIPYCEFEGTVKVENNTEYTATSDAEWLSVSKNERGISFTAQENNTGELREATVTLKSTDGKITRNITINQDTEEYSNDADSKAKMALKKMSLDDKLKLIVGINSFYTQPIESIGLPALFMADGPQGIRTGSEKAIAYPAGSMLAATWNKDMAYDYGRALGRDCRARGINYILGPGVNICRSPRNGRNFEYFGEDPWLASMIACGYINGAQSNKGVICMMKHFAANFMEYGRLEVSSDVDERTLQEIYFPAFRNAVEHAKVGSIMSGYNLVNGIYCFENEYLMQTVLRDQWKYPFMSVSDWGGPYFSATSGWYPNQLEKMLNEGADFEAATPGYYQTKPDEVKKLIDEGKVKVENIDKKVLNILRTIYYFHLDEFTEADKTISKEDKENIDIAYQVATEGLVLLRNNNNVLPLDPTKAKKIGVMGNNADVYVAGSGSGLVDPYYNISTLAGLTEKGKDYGISVEFIDYSDVEPIANKNGRVFFYTDEACTVPGFTACYYSNKNLEGTPVTTRTEQNINNNWEGLAVSGIGSENFSATWTAYLKVDTISKATFKFTADDGMYLAIDGKRVINDWNDNSEHYKTHTQYLLPGKIYKIEAGYYQAGGGAVAKLEVTRDNKNYKTEQLAKMNECDAIIVCEGFNQKLEGENIDRTFALPSKNMLSINNALKGDVPVIVILNSGGSVDMHTWYEKVDGIIWASYPGMEGGNAIADMLFGKVNPSGKLPMTFEMLESDNPSYGNYDATDRRVQFKEGIFVGYRGFEKNNKTPLYPFGFGLSYTTFEMSDLKATPTGATVTVTNTGSREGSEVVQIYIGPAEKGSVERPAKELRGFAKVKLQPGESKTVSIDIDKYAYSYYDTTSKGFKQIAGTYNVFAGNSYANLPLQTQVEVK